ncbi:MAG: hypothetical protein ACM3KH_00910 [Thiobacillus sp.]
MSKENKSIQKKTEELNKMIEWFDSEDFDLELALDKFKQAEKLAEEIENDLKNLKNEITVIKKKFDS